MATRAGNMTVAEAAQSVGLAVSTLRSYLKAGRSDLVRGLDFYCHRYALNRHRNYITPRGLHRLRVGAYRAFAPNYSGPVYDASWHGSRGIPPRYEGSSAGEQSQRLKSRIFLASLDYEKSPCALANCPCIVHRLGMPQADELAQIAELRARRRKHE